MRQLIRHQTHGTFETRQAPFDVVNARIVRLTLHSQQIESL